MKKYKNFRIVKYKPSKRIKNLAKQYRNNLIEKKTKWETTIIKMLDLMELRHKFQFIIYYPYSFYILDFYLPDHKLVIEVDGNQHYTEDGLRKDKKRDSVLNKIGLKVLRLKNSEVSNLTTCIEKINSYL